MLEENFEDRLITMRKSITSNASAFARSMKKIKMLITKAFYETMGVLCFLGELVVVFVFLCGVPYFVNYLCEALPFGTSLNAFIVLLLLVICFVLGVITGIVGVISDVGNKMLVLIDKPVQFFGEKASEIEREIEEIKQNELLEYLRRRDGIKK